MSDQYAPDGVISCGERLVRKGGKLFFGGYIVQGEQLIPWIGKYVFVSVGCYFFLDVDISDANDYTKHICKLPVHTKK